MGKYRVETSNGTFMVETDEPSSAVSPLAPPPPPKPPLPAGLQPTPHLDAMKQALQAGRDQQSAAMAPRVNIGGAEIPAPIGLPINGLMNSSWRKLDDLWAGAANYFKHPEEKAGSMQAMQAGGMQAGKIAAAAAISKLLGGSGGDAGASLMFGNDQPVATATGLTLGRAAGMLPKLASVPGLSSLSALGPVTRVMDNGAKVVTPAARPGLATLIQSMAGQAGANVGASAGDGQPISPIANVLMGLLGVGGSAAVGLGSAGTRTPAFSSESLMNELSKMSGLPRESMAGGKFQPPVAPTQFSGLGGDAPAIGNIGADGSATMAPTMPKLPTMDDVVGHLRDIAQTTKKGVTAGARAIAPSTPASEAGTLGAIFAGKKAKPGAKPPVAPASASPVSPEPPKDDKLKPDEESRPVMAGSGGEPVSAPGSGPVPGDVPPAPAVAPADAKIGRGYGRTSSVSIPETDTRYTVRYRLRELDDLNASHNEQSFDYNPKYPYDNERDYSLDVNQPRVVENSTPDKFEHERVVNDSPEATSGPPITDDAGNGMGGNNRLMMLKRLMRDPSAVEKHRALLRGKASQFGYDPAELDTMKKPVLVREMQPGAVTKDNAQDIIADFNVDPSARKSLEEQAMSDAKRLKPEHWDHLGKIIEEMPEGETMRGILGDARRGPGIIHYLTDTGVFKKNELAKLLTEEGSVTAEAKDRVENMLVGRMFRDARQMVNTPSEVKQKLGGVAGIVARLRNYPEWDITHQLPEAISALEHGRVNGFANLGDMNKQMDLSGNTANFDDSTLAIADALKKRGPKVFANKLKTYLQHAETANGARPGNMFEEPKGLEQAFSEAFDAPRGLKPAPRPTRANNPKVAADLPAEAAAPAKQPDAPAIDEGDVPPGPHHETAEALNKAMANRLTGKVTGRVYDQTAKKWVWTGKDVAPYYDALKTADASLSGDLGLHHDMIDAARTITPEQFEPLAEMAHVRAKQGRNAGPAQLAYWQSKNPEKAAAYIAAREAVGHRLGLQPEEVDRLGDALASIRAKAAGFGDFGHAPYGLSSKIPLSQALDLAEHATRHPNAVEAAPAVAPAVEPAPAPAAAKPSPTVAPAAPKPDVPKLTEEQIRAAVGEERFARAKAAQQASQRGGPVEKPPTAPPKPPIWAGRAQPKPIELPDLKPASESEIAKAVGPERFSRFKAGQTAQPKPDNPAAVKTKQREAAARGLAEFLGTLYDRASGSFKQGSSNKLADYVGRNRALVDTATDGNSQGLQAMMDNMDAAWTDYSAAKSRGRLSVPVGKMMGLPGPAEGVRIHLDTLKNPLASRREAAMTPTSSAAETMRYLAKHPETPAAYVNAAMRGLFSGALWQKDEQAKK